MAFHTPDPKMRAIEQRNAEARAALFATLFRTAWRGLSKAATLFVRCLSPTSRHTQRRGSAPCGRGPNRDDEHGGHEH
ncbi:hypothetical protein ACUN9Y_16775 [Halomonas sp. V046]|uniref:hypothetical protein n=1 Tax=Halomonas sp. V046 TaxID=3459611 RepID=UPI004043E421